MYIDTSYPSLRIKYTLESKGAARDRVALKLKYTLLSNSWGIYLCDHDGCSTMAPAYKYSILDNVRLMIVRRVDKSRPPLSEIMLCITLFESVLPDRLTEVQWRA